MPRTNEEFHSLMRNVLSGSQEAAQELFRDYERYILQVIRHHLDKRMRSKFDSLDFAQDVWASFFADLPEKGSFGTPGELARFLAKLARHKIVDAVRQQVGTQKNDANRDQSLDDSQRFNKDDLLADQPTPSQVFMKQEEWVEFLRKQPLVYRRIFVLMRDGKSRSEIACELAIDEKTITRVIDRVIPWQVG